MNKMYLSVVLFGALLAASAGTFTSCKDYDDDIKGLQEQIDKSGSTITDLQSQLTTLKAAADAAQATADAAKTAAAEAKTAADAAKAAGDDAAVKAAEAKVLAEEAKAAAATAKAEAIEEVTKQVTALKTLMEQALAEKVDQSVFDAAILAVNAQIKAIDENLSKLAGTVEGIDAKVATNTSEIADAKKAIETLIAADANLQTQLDQLKAYAEATQDLAEDNQAKIEAAEAEIEASKAEIVKLWEELAGANTQIASLITLTGEHTNLIAALTGRVGATEAEQAKHAERIAALESGLGLAQADITALTTALGKTNEAMSTMESRIDGELDAIRTDISGIQTRLTTIDGQIRSINTDLAGLHVLIVSRLSSISFAPDYIVDGVEAIKFSSLIYNPMGTSENAEIPDVNYKHSTAAPSIASYHFNPATFNLANADYNYIDRTAEVITTTRAAASQLVQVIGIPEPNAEQGTVEFKLRRLNAHSTQPELSQTNLVALQATMKNNAVNKGETGAVVTGDYVAIYDELLNAADVRIADDATLTEFGDEAHYATTFRACTKEAPRYTMDYNKEFNLKELVATCFGSNPKLNPTYIHRKFPIEDYNLSYRFAVATTEYNITTGSTTTNQQKWIKCNDAKEGLYQAEDFSKEAIGRTPIMKVELVDAEGNVVRRGFVKVQIGVTKSDDMTLPVILDPLTYQCNATKATYEMSEDYIRENLYRKIANSLGETGMSHEEFWNTYDANGAIATVTKNGVVFGMPVPRIVAGPAGSGVSTKKIVWSFTHGDLGQIGSGSTFVASVTVKNKLASSEYPAAVTFRFTIDVKLPTLTEKLTKADTYWTLAGTSPDDFDVNVAIPAPGDDVPENCQFKQNLDVAYSVHEPSGLPECDVTDYYEIIETKSNGKATSTILSGVKIDGREISLDKNDAAVKAALNSDGGLQAVVKHAYRLENGESLSVHSFVVNFIRPVNLNMPGEISLQDAKSGGDVANFQHDRLLTDWRGEAITNGYYVPVTGSVSYWDFNYTPKYERVDGHYELEQEAKLEVITKDVSFTAARPVTMFTATATYKNIGYDENGEPNGEEQTATFTAEAETQADADNGIRAQLLAYNWSVDGYYTSGAYQVGETSYSDRVILKGELVEYTYVADIKYTPAKYHWVDGTWEEVKHEHTGTPDYNGTTEGQTGGCGCYIWKTYTVTTDQEVGRNFWYFYGPIGDVKLDVEKATTNLEDKKLPNEATLVQDGNTVRYDNIHSPVGSEYKIFIPATVTYGWGTATSQLTITVKPVEK